MKTVYLAMGSNVGDRAANIARTIQALPGASVRVLRQSSVYVTEPVDFEPQGWFLNCVVEAETDLMPRQLLRALRKLEEKLGRKKLVRRGPRAIDIDILFYGSSVVRALELEIPHPRLTERRFVLVPLAELRPGFRHPVLGMCISELLAATPDHSSVRRWQQGSA